ncbi:DNA-directed RNA polymerase subunit A' [Candidatus Woesearchaeota archaeon]|nr:DNA-directed RNA polymerase subunit A' [Candidatus Woesearchaeota archaeon]
MTSEYIYKKVGSIVFGLLSPRVIKKMASVKIVTPELYDKEGYPVDGGLMDIKLGVIDPGLRCKTCNCKLKECPGHFGYMDLARPVVHIKYVKQILNFLKYTCRECGKFLVLKENLKGKGLKGFKTLKDLGKCPHCQAKQFKVKFEKPSSYVENDIRLSPIEVRARIEKISDEDIKLFGYDPEYARPEWMILTLLPIPPVTVRPSITLESGERSEDDLTHKLGDIVRINQRLFENINAGAPEIIIEDLWDLLQYHVTTYFDNEITQVPPARHRSGQPLKTLSERIKSKEGRFRYNLAGKRVNYAARTVISPDPKIRFNEVGIPKSVAMELTIPERVTSWNVEWLKELINNGPKKYLGANYVITLDHKKKKIAEETKEQILIDLIPGCVVERHLMHGDICVFNRQPSLHRMSIMCHKIVILPGSSFRLNPGVCTPYNADFDGDEMNLHIPQTEEARAEADILMQVQSHIITPKNGYNVVGCTNDAITGNYLLTDGLSFTREEAVQILYSIGVTDFSTIKGKNIEGKDIFGALLPRNFDFIGNSRDGRIVKIEKGKLVEGFIDKATIGEDNGTLIRALYAKYGEEAGIDLLGKLFRLGIEVLLRNGFTTSISDTDLPENVVSRNKELTFQTEKKVEELIQQYKDGKLEAMPALTSEETLEKHILQNLNSLRNKIGEIVFEHIQGENSTILMAKSGATGNILNVVQMAASVGQQSLRGGRIRNGYRLRTLPIFEKGSLSPLSKGFVYGGYRTGLTPTEYFFHAMTGRDSLMDTALRTPKSGYLYRRLSNALQDLKVEYDLTVRDANGKIVQFKYGDDGIDVHKSEGGKINVSKIVKEVMAYG